MNAPVTTDLIWREVAKRSFAVLSFATSTGELRSAGVVYIVEGRRLYVVTGRATLKARCLHANPQAAVTVTISKRIPFMPWIQIPAAAISFHGTATVHGLDEVDAVVARRLGSALSGLDGDPTQQDGSCVIGIEPVGGFATYGVGVPLMAMRDPAKASGRAPVA